MKTLMLPTAASHVIHGTKGLVSYNSVSGDVLLYSRKSGKWKTLQCEGKKPSSRRKCACTVVDSKLVIYGGIDEDEDICLNDLYLLTLNQDDGRRWLKVAISGDSIPLQGHSITQTHNGLIILGGYCGIDDTSFNKSIFLYPYDGSPWRILNISLGINGRVESFSNIFTSVTQNTLTVVNGDTNTILTTSLTNDKKTTSVSFELPPVNSNSPNEPFYVYSPGVQLLYAAVGADLYLLRDTWYLIGTYQSTCGDIIKIAKGRLAKSVFFIADDGFVAEAFLLGKVTHQPLTPRPPMSPTHTDVGGTILPPVRKRVVSATLRGLPSKRGNHVRDAIGRIENSTLDLRDLNLECGDIYLLSMCINHSKVCYQTCVKNSYLKRELFELI